jgi:hypothetical protein
MGVDPFEAERALPSRRLADGLLQPVVVRRLENTVLGADLFHEFRVGREGVGAEDGVWLDDVAKAVVCRGLGAALQHGIDVPPVAVDPGQDGNPLPDPRGQVLSVVSPWMRRRFLSHQSICQFSQPNSEPSNRSKAAFQPGFAAASRSSKNASIRHSSSRAAT